MNIYQSAPGQKKLKTLLSENCWSLGCPLLGANVCCVSKAVDEQGEVDGTILLYICRVSALSS